MQRLEELMQWQRQQQEKLLRHQQEQKALITFEQKRLFQEIGSILEQGNILSSTKENSDKQDVDNTKHHELHLGEARELDQKDTSVPQMQGSFDEMPVKQVTKSFTQLLQEKLSTDENGDDADANVKPKRKFLKKGEGLARYRMTLDKSLKRPPRLTKKVDLMNANEEKGRKLTGNTSSLAPSGIKSVVAPVSENQQGKKGPTSVRTHSVEQTHLSLNTKSLYSPKKVRGLHCVSEQESQDELHLFELLEQQAANSSFCSTSSVVMRFLGDPSAQVTNSVDYKKNTSQSATVENRTLPHTLRQPEIISNPYRSSNNLNAISSNANITKAHVGCTTRNSQLERIAEFCDSSCNTPLKSTNEKLLLNSEQTVHEKLVPNNIYESENETKKNDLSNSLYCNGKIPSGVEVPQDKVQYRHKSLSTALSSVDDETDIFRDSEVWSDCSCSSCGETGTESEHEVPNPPLQQAVTSEEHCDTDDSKNKSVQECTSDHRDAITFKSALLKERLAELESEIDIFKKENAHLKKLKQQYERDIANFNKEKKEHEKILKENTEKMQESILAERRKLAREKQVFERYSKEKKSQPTRQEREEIQALKQQIAELQEELIRKDTRWSANQVRTRDRMRQLNKELSQLREENEKLKAEKAKIKRVRFSNPKVSMVSNTKVLHSINEKLAQLKVDDLENPIVIKNVVPRKRIPAHVLCQSTNDMKGKDLERNTKIIHAVPDLQSKLQKATVNADKQNDDTYQNFNDESNISEKIMYRNSDEEVFISEEACESKSHSDSADTSPMHMLVYHSFFPSQHEAVSRDVDEQNTDLHIDQNSDEILENEISETPQNGSNSYSLVKNQNVISHPLKNTVDTDGPLSPLSEVCVLSQMTETQMSSESLNENAKKRDFSEIVHTDGTREKNFSDGRQEIWYANGNVKKVSPDKMTTKMIYFNGDVKEKYFDGIEKYYYAGTKTWQTTYSDGREVIEFPSGQVECKMPNGTVEITYPNGSTLLKHRDGHEKLTLTDGTVVSTSASGIKEIVYPNGQKEIHAEDHKRREYPDGTVKLVYLDGSQESRYASGRVRRKDKDGNIIMDSVRT
ncbi:Centromere protein J [Gryllus bimaculatus]|nr:Centromere protein J [Gryllus bimaculatus]